MNTLTEIESAMESLSAQQQEMLLRHLEMKLHGRSAVAARVVLENGVPVLVAPFGAPEMNPAVVKAALVDFP